MLIRDEIKVGGVVDDDYGVDDCGESCGVVEGDL